MSKYLLFLDESGDHGLKTIDPSFPIFVLTGLLFSEAGYQEVCQKIDAFKKRFFNKLEVILHRRDMRKYERGFEILFDVDVKQRFYTELNKILQEANYKIIASVINKQKHIEQYGKLADDPYEIALTFVLERILFEADEQRNITGIHVTIEGRGKKEDALLAKRYNEILYRGTGQIESQRLLLIYDQELEVRLKRDNDCGLQLADLCAYPIARYFMNNNEPNPAYDSIKGKIRRGPKGVIGYGIKIFPE
jgi:hypothetical protein